MNGHVPPPRNKQEKGSWGSYFMIPQAAFGLRPASCVSLLSSPKQEKKKKREEKATTAVPPPRHLFCRVSSIALPLLPALHRPLFPRRRWMCVARCPQHPYRSLCHASGVTEEVHQEATPRQQPPVTWKRALPLTPQPIRRDGFRGNNLYSHQRT